MISLRAIPWTPDLDMRAVMVANARSCVGMHGGTRESVAELVELRNASHRAGMCRGER